MEATVELQGIQLIDTEVFEIEGVGFLFQEMKFEGTGSQFFQAVGYNLRAVRVGQSGNGEGETRVYRQNLVFPAVNQTDRRVLVGINHVGTKNTTPKRHYARHTELLVQRLRRSRRIER